MKDERMLLSNFNLLATAPSGVARLRELILTLAVQGKLVPQNPGDEPASVLLTRVAQNKTAQSAKSLKATTDEDGILAPYELPSGWGWVRLGEIVENMGSGWSPACDEGERSDPTQWAVLRTTAVQVNEYRPREHKVVPLKLSPRPEIEVKDGDILITRAGPMNRVGISCWVNNTPPRLMLSDKIVRFHSVADEMLPAFIVLALNAGRTKNQIEAAKTGMAASQVNISQTDLRGLWMPVCSKAEQSRIVTRVEELMCVCDALEAKGKLEAAQHAQLLSTLLGTLADSDTPEALAENWQRIATHFDLLLDRPKAIDAFEQTILQLAVRGLLVPRDPSDKPASALLKKIRAEKDRLIAEGKIRRDKPLVGISEAEKPFELPVGWEWVPLQHIGYTQTGTTPAKKNPEMYGDDTPFIKPGDIYPSHVEYGNEALSQVGLIDSGRVAPAGSLLMVCIGTIGKSNLVTRDCSFNQQINSITPLCCSSGFVKLYCRSPYFQSEAWARSSSTTIAILNKGKWEAIPVALPPLAEQARIVARVEDLMRLCADLRQRLAARQATQAQLAHALIKEEA